MEKCYNEGTFLRGKEIGILNIADYIGMPRIEKGNKWAVAVNRNRFGKDRWKLIKILEEGKFKFFDIDDETIINTRSVKNYPRIINKFAVGIFLLKTI